MSDTGPSELTVKVKHYQEIISQLESEFGGNSTEVVSESLTLARVYKQAGRLGDAHSIYLELLGRDLSPDDQDNVNNAYGATLWSLGNFQSAAMVQRDLLRRAGDPGSDRAVICLANLTKSLVRLGEIDGLAAQIELMDASRAVNADHAASRRVASEMYYLAGVARYIEDFDLASRLYQRVRSSARHQVGMLRMYIRAVFFDFAVSRPGRWAKENE